MEQQPCNMCGRYPGDQEPANIQEFRIQFAYGSRRDLTQSRFHLCPHCLDKVYEAFKAQCEIAPEEWELF